MNTYKFELTLDDWKHSVGTCKGTSKPDARKRLYKRLKKKGFRKFWGKLTETNQA